MKYQNDESLEERATGSKPSRGIRNLVLGLLVGIGVVIFFSSKVSTKKLTESIIKKHTTKSPKTKPPRPLTDDEREVLATKWQQIVKARTSQERTTEFELSAREINVILSRDPRTLQHGPSRSSGELSETVSEAIRPPSPVKASSPPKAHFLLSITNKQIRVKFSIPLSRFGIRGFGNRYLNASGRLRARIVKNQPQVFLEPTEINGHPPSPIIRARVRDLDLYKIVIKPAHPLHPIASRVRKVRVVEDRVRFELLPTPAPPVPTASHGMNPDSSEGNIILQPDPTTGKDTPAQPAETPAP